MSTPKTPASDAGREIRILIVDDSVASLRISRAMLAAASYTCSEALNGDDALAMILRERFDVVITDLEMPKVDGFDLLRAIANLPSGAYRPKAIVHSARLDDPRVLARPELRHANALLHKPASPGTLLGAINATLNPDLSIARLAGRS